MKQFTFLTNQRPAVMLEDFVALLAVIKLKLVVSK